MSYVQKNMKFLKGKEKSLQFFENYLDIFSNINYLFK